METITQKIARFYSLIENYQEGAQGTRYKSWEWCHHAFMCNKNILFETTKTEEEKESIIDYLSLHLAFYLASWGMYRGSSYLLQRDYKAHKKAIRAIMQPKYDILWDYNPTLDSINNANNLLFNRDEGIYWLVKNSYDLYEEKAGESDEASATLVTKILLGTFGCIPAFDRYLKSGIKQYIKMTGEVGLYHERYKLSQNIENYTGSATEAFKALAALAVQHASEFAVDCDFHYPPMKCVDMYFWQIGYEIDLADTLRKESTNDRKKQKLLRHAIDMGLCSGDNYMEAAKEIERKNTI